MHQWALVHSKTGLTFFSSWLGQTCSVCAFSPLTYRQHLPADGPMGVAIITGFLRRKVGGGAGRGRGGSQGLFRSPPMPLHCGCCSVAQSCLTLCHPMDCSTPGFPVHHQPQSLLKLMSIESVMPSKSKVGCLETAVQWACDSEPLKPQLFEKGRKWVILSCEFLRDRQKFI